MKFITNLVASIALASVLVPLPLATSAEISHNEAGQSASAGAENGVLGERIAKAREDGQALLIINEADEGDTLLR